MVDETKISREMRNQFGTEFDQLLEKHQFLIGVWRNSDNPELMLWLLRLSPYRNHYYSELCDFGKSLFVEQIAKAENLGRVDTILARQKPKIEERHAKRLDQDEIVQYELWELAFDVSHLWMGVLAQAAIGEAIFAGKYPEGEADKIAFQVATCTSLRLKHANRLRELIYTPFLPKINCN